MPDRDSSRENGVPSPDERHERFAEENKSWDRQIDTAIQELDRLVEADHGPVEPAPAKPR